VQVQEVRRDPLSGQLFCFRGRSGNLLHDGQEGACLFTKRLERGRVLWPSPADGAATIPRCPDLRSEYHSGKATRRGTLGRISEEEWAAHVQPME
jgi:hypothetical protein